MKPICVKCKRFYRPVRNGYYFIEGMPITNTALPGDRQPELWKPYKMWVGDKWKCGGCGAEIVVGVPPTPLGEHYQTNFDEKVRTFGADQLQVNDC